MASSAMTLDNATKLVLQLATLMQLKRLNFGLPSAVAVLNQKFRALCANDDISDKSKFYVVFDILKAEILLDPAAHHTPESRNWVEKMLQHNVPHGKLNRGLAVVDSYKHLKGGKITEDEFFLASVLGWAIEWLQACFLVLDDIMDESQTRRGQPCWFRLPWVGNIAVNDGVLLHGHIGRILKRHFYSKHFCADLLDVFNEVGFQTACGQLLDLMTTYEKDLRRCTLPNYLRIVEYKTAYYSFYLPVACALLMAGENLDNHIAVKQILVKMGIYFQVQDDYLDCFGDPKVSGKIGTDIEDFKCSWLLVQALQRADASQLERLNANYGKKDPGCLSDVKALYNELRLQDAFLEYENNSYEELTVAIEEHESEPIRFMLKAFLDKIYKRQK